MQQINIFVFAITIFLLVIRKKHWSFLSILISQVLIPQWDIYIHTYLSLIWLIIYPLSYKHKKQNNWVVKLYLYYSAIIFLLCIVAEIPVSKSLINAIYMLIGLFGLSVVGLLSIDSREDLIEVLWFLVCLIGGTSLYGIYTIISFSNPYTDFLSNWFTGISDYVESFSGDIRSITMRVTGIFVHPLVLSEFSLLSLCILMIIVRILKYRVIIWILIIMQFILLLTSGSRSCIFSAIIFVVIFTINNVTNVNFWIKICVFAIPLGVWGYSKIDNDTKNLINASLFIYDVNKSSDIGGSSIELRQQQFQRTFNMDVKSVVVGKGPGYIAYATEKNKRDSGMMGYESIIFSKVAEEGIVGLIAFISIILKFYFNTCSGLNGVVKLQIFAFYFAYLVCIVMTNIQGTGHIFFLFCLILYLCKRYNLIN